MTRKRLIVCNWKMNPQTESEALDLFGATLAAAKAAPGATVIVAPPFPFLSAIENRFGLAQAEANHHAQIYLAAQDVFWERDGSFTGEVSAVMEKNVGVTHVIIGHSERRRFLGETDDMVAKKLKKALESGLIPILCIGEEERPAGEIPERVGEELQSAVVGLNPTLLETLVVAYEPVWAIGSGTPDTPEGMQKAALYIRKVLTECCGESAADKIRILYGGSVTAANVAAFFEETGGQVAGVLVGGASLYADEVDKIIKTVNLIPADMNAR
ncbi:MAG: triose-phosphate isomerase [Candidatus Sungbacteria bacterium]|uniref:Triosephosphate isomerase n=1 Tax=Candidatus Sungiibacteriota bacterium TaxID=2750080 RepID=A0A931SBS2_9BACT|nr:triose-phosphate isomerase [Candidatus Sungbacteria bacterium]